MITYPLFTNVFAFNTFAQGLSSVSAYFGGIHELLSHPDAYDVIVLYSSAHTYFNRDLFESDLDARLEADRLKRRLFLASDPVQSIDCDRPGAGVGEDYVVTPFRPKTDSRSTVVPVLVNWIYASTGSSYSTERNRIDDFLRKHTSAVQLRDADLKYNCRSYAWYYHKPGKCRKPFPRSI